MTFKVLILGDAGVGKTSLRTQFFHKSFTVSYRATIGANFLTKNILLSEDASIESTGTHASNQTDSNATTTAATGTVSTPISVSLCIWDTAGQERFNSLSSTFFRGSDCAILLYDMTNIASLSGLEKHYREFVKYSGTKTPLVVIVGNKSDATQERCVTPTQLDQFMHSCFPESVSAPLCFEVSAKLGHGVTRVFQHVARLCHIRSLKRDMQAFEVDDPGPTGRECVDLGKRSRGPESRSCSC